MVYKCAVVYDAGTCLLRKGKFELHVWLGHLVEARSALGGCIEFEWCRRGGKIVSLPLQLCESAWLEGPMWHLVVEIAG